MLPIHMTDTQKYWAKMAWNTTWNSIFSYYFSPLLLLMQSFAVFCFVFFYLWLIFCFGSHGWCEMLIVYPGNDLCQNNPKVLSSFSYLTASVCVHPASEWRKGFYISFLGIKSNYSLSVTNWVPHWAKVSDTIKQDNSMVGNTGSSETEYMWKAIQSITNWMILGKLFTLLESHFPHL